MNIDPIQIEKKLTDARDELLDKFPQFAGCMALKYAPTYNCDTAATDGEHFLYNPEGIEPLTKEELVFLWLHEWLHVANLHFSRMEMRKAIATTACGQQVSVWNLATDYIINLDCVDVLGDGYFIKGGLLDEGYRGKSSEQVYSILVDKFKNKPPEDFKDIGGLVANNKSADDVKVLEERITRSVKRGLEVQQARVKEGQIKATQCVLDKILNEPIPYQDQLLKFLQSDSCYDWSYRKFVDRGDNSDIVYPSLSKTRKKKPTIAIDTSASITEEEINLFVGESLEIFRLLGLQEVEVIYCDWEVRNRELINDTDQIPKPSGGCGTDFAPVTDLIHEEYGDHEVLIYYTDGYCDSFGTDPIIPVMWVVTTDVEFEPPFGKTIRNIK
jgi:predicted metal-dependent peptidase